MTYLNYFKYISKPWANVKDIMILACCGRDEATRIRNLISNEIMNNGKRLPETKMKIVPTEFVINYLNLDIEHISFMAHKEKLIDNASNN